MEGGSVLGLALAIARKSWPPVALSFGLSVIALIVSIWGTSIIQRTALQMYIMVVLVVALYIFSGNSGVLQFGHAGFMALGAYAAALLTIPVEKKQILFPYLPGFLAWIRDAQVAFIPATLAAAGFAAIIGLLLTIPLMRLAGAPAGIATFAVLIIIRVVLQQADSITRGPSGVVGTPEDTTLTVALIWAIITIVCAYLYQQSRRGLRLRASREDEQAARSVGINVPRERGIAFVISAFFLAVGGVLSVHFITVFSPDTFFIPITFLTVAMLVIGGTNSLTGAVVGVVFLTTVSEFLRRFEIQGLGPIPGNSVPAGLTEVILALILLAVLILRPSGITGGKEIPWPTWKTAAARGGWGGMVVAVSRVLNSRSGKRFPR
jgi:branched-chain amino acid transport system permease protein